MSDNKIEICANPNCKNKVEGTLYCSLECCLDIEGPNVILQQ